MSSQDVEGYPQYPSPPPGTSRRDHLPTVEASIRYWKAIETRAAETHDRALMRTAAGLRLSYEAIRNKLGSLPNPAKRGRPKKG
jgi:hypothetical protein